MTLAWVEWGSPEYREAIELRRVILRLPLGLDFTPEQLEEERDNYHLVAIKDGQIVGCLVLTPRSSEAIQMRQVAVSPELRSAGIGRAMILESERHAANLGYQEMMLHAREVSTGFYDRLGYQRRGDKFVEVGIPHFEMFKSLINVI